ncbi:uncharacterized protein LOC134194459 isoform X2 [Corticium candelabrum]|uniref:uncharacterized protein LOC134194459 isoform X2 n=1 Tax=Corticium candelabrum TaxID=121492 RepID=UPI002E254E78|nr:uncharacterized protein LOC134194459 isoform X2 [Corticium candelabrum]
MYPRLLQRFTRQRHFLVSATCLNREGIRCFSQISANEPKHFAAEKNEDANKSQGSTVFPHPIWSAEDVHSVKVTHTEPKTSSDKLAYWSVQLLRFNFDLFSGFKFGKRHEGKWLNRIIFLETVAGVPGMVAAMTRHLHSLRKMRRDHGWIHTLLEAENERMHLMTALKLRNPSILFRAMVLMTQGIFVNVFFLCYLVSPSFCHRFVGYLEEEAVKTYTKCLEDMDAGHLPIWQHTKAPAIAKDYWKLGDDAMMRDVILAIRADEAHHRLVNHTLSTMDKESQNPYLPGAKKL